MEPSRSRFGLTSSECPGTLAADLLKIIKAKVEGITLDMPVIGRWRSADGDTFYLAIGAIIDRDGKPVTPSAK